MLRRYATLHRAHHASNARRLRADPAAVFRAVYLLSLLMGWSACWEDMPPAQAMTSRNSLASSSFKPAMVRMTANCLKVAPTAPH